MDNLEETQKLLAMSGPLSDTLKWLLSHLNGSMVRREMYGHGIGRFSKEEVYALMEKDMRTLATLLGREKTVCVHVCVDRHSGLCFLSKPLPSDSLMYSETQFGGESKHQ